MKEESNGDFNGLHEKLNQLPGEVQAVITAFSSFFLEADKFNEYRSDPSKIETVRIQLREGGLDDEAIDIAMQVIGFTELPNVADNT